MAANQTVARDLSSLIRDLKALEDKPGLDPMVQMMLKLMIKMAEVLRRQARTG